ncbi:hypothetical protein LTS18_013294, partial [Coniosporium uncinatum]
MSSKQGTLNKFFGKPNGTKPPNQQSKLSFSNKSKANDEPKQEANREEPEEDVRLTIKDEDVDMADAKTGAEQKPSNKNEDGEASTSPKAKRKKDVEEEDDSAEDAAEPPSKKKRASTPVKAKPQPKASPKVKKAPKSTQSNGTSSIAEGFPKPAAKVKTEAASKPKVVAKEAPKAGKKRPRKVIEEEEEDEEQEEDEQVAEATKAAIASTKASPPAKAEESVSEQEDEQEEDSEDEKPEVAAKAREKVQSTLQANTKDPYPDWKAGDPVPYAALCTTFSKIEMTTKRLEILAHCSLFLRQVLRLTPKDLVPTILLMINKLAADYAGIELGIGESLIMKAIGETTGRSLQIIKADQNEIGDLGLVAAKSRSNQPTMFKPKPLTVRGVHEGLMNIATVEGQGSQGRKVAGIKKLLSSADAHLAGKGSKGVDITKDKGGP